MPQVFMDGTEVLIGAPVHDVARGEGAVIEVDTDKIIARFGRQQFAYSPQGVGAFGRRTLYWADPIIIAPPCNRVYWLFLSGMMREAFSKMAEMLPKVVHNAQ